MLARLAWRSIWRHRRRTMIALASIAIGLAFVVFWVTLAEGVYNQLVGDAVRMQSGHVTVEHREYLDAPAVDLTVPRATTLRTRIDGLDGVECTKLLVVGQGIARSGADAAGIAVLGVEPAVEAGISPLAANVIAGEYLEDTDGPWVVIGTELADRLELAVGRKLVIATNDKTGALVEALFRVKGIFRTGADEVDGYLLQMPIAEGRRLFGLAPDEATRIAAVLEDADSLVRARKAIGELVSSETTDAVARTWHEVLPELYAFIRLDRVSDYTFQWLLIGLVLFTILNTMLMSVLEREHELAVMLAIGTPARKLRLQILIETAYVGAIGTTAGLVIGGVVAYAIQVHGWDLSSLYREGVTVSGLAMSTRVHAKVTAELLLRLGMIVFLATLALAWIPIRRVRRIHVVEALQ